jgi:hypothetical protein
MKKTLLVLSALLSVSAMADDVYLGKPGYGGSGCPQGSASAVLSPDHKSLSILFDRFQTEAGGTTRRSVDRKNCDIAIPVHIPQGYSVSLFQMDYRGFNSLPAGGSSRLGVEYFFAGQRGPVSTRVFNGSLNADYLVSDRVGASAMIWSACGKDVNLRVNASLMTRTNSYMQQAMSTVDSADIKSGLVYHLQWKRCN